MSAHPTGHAAGGAGLPDMPATLEELTSLLGDHLLDGASQSTIMFHLLRCCRYYGFRMRYDEFDPGQYNPALVRERAESARKQHAQAEAKRGRTVSFSARSSHPKLITLEEHQKRMKKGGRGLPDQAPPKEPAALPKKGREAKNRTLQVQVCRGRLQVLEDPALRDPRDPPDAMTAKSRQEVLKLTTNRSTCAADPHLFDYLDEGNKLVGRVLIYREGRGVNPHSRMVPLENSFGSAVFDAVTWMPLAITPRPFTKKIHKGLVDEFLGSNLYQIVKTNDGTLGTLYNWHHPRVGPIWCMSSQRGWDVFPLEWPGGGSWAEALVRLLKPYQDKVEDDEAKHPGCPAPLGDIRHFRLVKDLLCDGDIRVSLGNLSADRCYTIGMRDHGAHPLKNDPEGLWNVQSIDLRFGAGMAASFDPDLLVPHLPYQHVLVPERLFESSQPKLALLEEMCKGSLEKAKSAIAAGKNGFEHFHYGFILRSLRPDLTGEYSDIIIESELIDRVRDLMYGQPLREDREWVGPETKILYNGIRGLLNESSRESVLTLFPQFKPHDEKIRQFLHNVQRYVIDKARRPGGTSASGKPNTSSTASLGEDVYAQIIEQHSQFNGFARGKAEAIVKGYLYDSANALLILAALDLEG